MKKNTMIYIALLGVIAWQGGILDHKITLESLGGGVWVVLGKLIDIYTEDHTEQPLKK